MADAFTVTSGEGAVEKSGEDAWAWPSHYTVKIKLFSLLEKHSVEKYESGAFEAGGYKWKLVLYPNGNKNKNVTDHISVNLALADPEYLQLGWEVCVHCRLFLLDQNKDNCVKHQDAQEIRFHGLKLEWGFDQFISLKKFKDPNNGYLVGDTCVLGAEVYVWKEKCSGKGESLQMINDIVPVKFCWEIKNFSKIIGARKDSKKFSDGDKKWQIQLYPKGNGVGTGTHLSLYLVLAEVKTLPPGSKICASIKLRIVDQVKGKHATSEDKSWFSASEGKMGGQDLF